MFRPMRRGAQQLTHACCEELLRSCTAGVLAVTGDDGYPYAVPLSYVYQDSCLYFHGAKTGHKLDAIRRDARASFCVIAQDTVVPEEYTTYFGSVIVFGRAYEVTDADEKRRALALLGMRYHPAGTEEACDALITREMPGAAVIRLDIEHMTGKLARELMQRRQP